MTYKTTAINNRRYLGNKYKLLPFISKVVDENCYNVNIFADLFAGTGSVSSAFYDKIIITNDILYSNYICNLAWFGHEKFDSGILKNIIVEYNALQTDEDNYMSINFADTFFGRDDCKKIGFIRDDIEHKYNVGVINERERALLITSLLYAMDKIANTCGHYDAYRQGVEYSKKLELYYPDANNDNNSSNRCYNMDINHLANNIYADLLLLQLEHLGTHHRCQRQRSNKRDEHDDTHHPTELLEEYTGHTGNHCQREEHGEHGQCRCHNRYTHLVCSVDSGVLRA